MGLRILKPESNSRYIARNDGGFLLLPDGAEKYYAGYSLLLRAPAWGGDQPRASETVREICAHWAEQTGGGLDKVTADFQAHRYAENALPAGAVAEMEKALRTADSEK